MRTDTDVAIIGGGILGMATALALSERFAGLRITIVEKEAKPAQHQSGRNSGVIHSGLYYRPGSLKARLCVAGAERMIAFCQEHGVPHRRDGKLVVATEGSQLPGLAELERRGTANGLAGLRRLGRDEVAEIEPNARAVAALHVPSTGTADFGQVVAAMARLLEAGGTAVRTSFAVSTAAISADRVELRGEGGTITARYVVNCAGLYADKVAAMMGVHPDLRIVPFRGEYYDVTGPSSALVHRSIYPVPDPDLPFLGVHLTRTALDGVHAGPNAVLALAREGYSWGVVRPGELWEAISYPGTLRLARRHWRTAITEVARSAQKSRFLRSVRELVPDIAAADLARGTSGVRAQAVDRTGAVVDDFRIVSSPQALHVLNAPSPAATASLVIGEHLAEQIARVDGLA